MVGKLQKVLFEKIDEFNSKLRVCGPKKRERDEKEEVLDSNVVTVISKREKSE